MKYLLTKLLLALSLVANPVAVLASDIESVGTQPSQTVKEASHDVADLHDLHSQLEQHDDADCDMPCCEDSECTMQHTCVVQHYLDLIIHKALRFSNPSQDPGWGIFTALLPDRELPPDNPPPIHI